MRAAVAAAAISAVGALVAAILPVLLDGNTAQPRQNNESSPSASLGANRALVQSVDLVTREGDLHKPTLMEITIHNTGGARAVISRVILTARDDVTIIDKCTTEGAGGLPVSGTYDLQLPRIVSAGQEFQVPISQQAAADEADRFALRVQIADAKKLQWSMYRFDVELAVGANADRVRVGTALLSLPGPPDPKSAGIYWNAQFENGEINLANNLDPQGVKRAEECMRSNTARIREFLNRPDVRSQELEALYQDLR